MAGLLDKINPKATPRSVLRRAVTSALVGAAFFLLFKPAVREAWRIVLPVWVLLCAAVGALVEWQVPDELEPIDKGGSGGGETPANENRPRGARNTTDELYEGHHEHETE